MKVRKRPVEVEAVQWTGTNLDEVTALDPMCVLPGVGDALTIITLEGSLTAHVGAWIIRGVKREVYPCADLIFRQTYDVVEEV